MNEKLKDYSQHGEQAVITKFFDGKPIGQFLDIGAYDGENLSNTKQLLLDGWYGIMIEPSPFNFVKLCDNLLGWAVVTLVNAAVTTTTGITSFFESNSPCSSTSEKHIQKFKADAFEIRTNGLTVAQLYQAFPQQFNFINIDVEGGNTLILRDILTFYHPELICVELDEPQSEKEIMDMVKGQYTLVKKCGGINLILAKV